MKRTLSQAYSAFEDLLPESPQAVELRENLYLARLEHGFKALEIYESIRPNQFGLRNREWELAHPLLAVAILIDESLVNQVLDLFKQLAEESTDSADRDEFKVLTVLRSLVDEPTWFDQGIPLKDINEKIVTQFEEEYADWGSKRVARACRLLNIRRYPSQGISKVAVRKQQIVDLSSRYLRQDDNTPGEICATQPNASAEPGALDLFLGSGVASVGQVGQNTSDIAENSSKPSSGGRSG